MTVIKSEIDKNSEAFHQYAEQMMTMLQNINLIEKNKLQKAEKSREKFAKHKQLLPHERVSHLLDRGAPFLEIASLAGFNMHDDQDGSQAGGGIIGGVGYVCGQCVVIYCNNSAIKGGTISPMGLEKTLRLQQIAMQNHLPMLYLVESGGANLEYQAQIFVAGGRCFANQARLSAMGIPQITIVHGSSTAGGAYLPGLSDYVIMVEGRAKLFLAGPHLLKAATGEIADEEMLGGANMHCQKAGTAEYLAEDDHHAILIARDIMTMLYNKNTLKKDNALPPIYTSEELLGIVPDKQKATFDMREIIARLVDESKFLEFKTHFDPYTLCGHAKLNHHRIGIIANNGPITPEGANKAAQFIQLCCQQSQPIIYLQNTTGYMVGINAEQNGIIKHGAKMIQAVANASVPQITIVIGGSYGAGNYGMCGRGLDPHFIFAWPSSRTSVMGSEQAADVMVSVIAEKNKRQGNEIDKNHLLQMREKIIARMEQESSALFASAHLFDDGIIDPRDTRQVLACTLEIVNHISPQQTPIRFGVARF